MAVTFELGVDASEHEPLVGVNYPAVPADCLQVLVVTGDLVFLPLEVVGLLDVDGVDVSWLLQNLVARHRRPAIDIDGMLVEEGLVLEPCLRDVRLVVPPLHQVPLHLNFRGLPFFITHLLDLHFMH